jgi:PAS domain S-box-containing protein
MKENNVEDHDDSSKIKRILRSKKGLEYIFDAIPDLIAVLDKDHRVVMVNKAMADKLNTLPDLCCGSICFEVVHNAKNPPNNCPHSKLLNDGLEHISEVDEENLGGYFIVTASPIKDDNGNLLGSIHIAHDITARKNAEEKIERHREELAKSNAELEHFAYVASHDLREPLRMITSFLQLLERRYTNQLDQDANEFIGFAVDGAKRLNEMINDLLTYSRVSTKKREFKMLNCEQILDETLTNLKIQIEESKAIITHESLPKIFVDKMLMVELFQNLITNAIKYQRQETPKIHISANKEGDQYCFAVKDNGIGIESEHLGGIFTIFQRLHTKDEYEGTGLGLAIAQKIVNEHSGHIWAESEVGKGSIFYFTIPQN